MAEHAEKLIDAGKPEQAAAALGGMLRRPKLRAIAHAAGHRLSEDATMADQMVDNAAALMETMGKGRGARSYQAERGVDTMLTGFVSGASPKKLKASSARGRKAPAQPTEVAAASEPSVRAIAKRLRMPEQTASRKLKKARTARRALDAKEEGAYLVDMSRRVQHAGRCDITPEKMRKLVEWISANPHVRTCPEKKQTILVRGADGKRNVRVPKLLCEINYTKLFLQAEKELPWLKMKERLFRRMLPLNLRRLTHRFEACGNPTRLKAARLHQPLCIFRRRLKARLAPRAATAYKPPDHANVYAALADGLPPECQPRRDRAL